jgi:hypothetical protein
MCPKLQCCRPAVTRDSTMCAMREQCCQLLNKFFCKIFLGPNTVFSHKSYYVLLPFCNLGFRCKIVRKIKKIRSQRFFPKIAFSDRNFSTSWQYWIVNLEFRIMEIRILFLSQVLDSQNSRIF